MVAASVVIQGKRPEKRTGNLEANASNSKLLGRGSKPERIDREIAAGGP
jgi:hypothetical protein